MSERMERAPLGSFVGILALLAVLAYLSVAVIAGKFEVRGSVNRFEPLAHLPQFSDK